jgi:signal transduction histidine kinase/ActR/RegA family two-component response regulator
MTDSPFSVYRLLRQHILSAAKPAYLVTDKQFNLVTASGELSFYELENLKTGCSCESSLSFLVGYDVNEAIELRFFQINEEVIAHVVLLPHEGHLIILFMDASAAYHQEVEIQQKTNDLLILSEKQDEIVKELVRARDGLAKKHDELTSANESKAKFIANMSDEIKSPLTSILGHASLLKNDANETSDSFKMIEAIERGGRHLLTMVENLLDQMDIELSNVKLKIDPVDINDLLQDLESIFSPLAKRKGLKFLVVTESLPRNRIKVDETRLRQVLVNLLNNSFKYTDMGTVRLTVAWKDNELFFEVYDTGCGVPESFQQEMFAAFKQGHERGKGKGLGLSVSKHLIDLMDGKISCQSVLGVETRFKISVPSELSESNQFASTIIEDIGFGENAHILIVDSNEDLCLLYDLALTKAGFNVSQCGVAQESITFAKEKNPNLILISLATFDESLNAIKEIRASGYNQPILVQISMEASDLSRAVFEVGANGYITKPINIIDLIETIKAYVSPMHTQESDVTMRTYLRERFDEFLNLKSRYLFEVINQLSNNNYDFDNCDSLEKEVRKILMSAEMYGYTAIANAAKSAGNILNNRDEYNESNFILKLLDTLKIFYSEIRLVLEK